MFVFEYGFVCLDLIWKSWVEGFDASFLFFEHEFMDERGECEGILVISVDLTIKTNRVSQNGLDPWWVKITVTGPVTKIKNRLHT